MARLLLTAASSSAVGDEEHHFLGRVARIVSAAAGIGHQVVDAFQRVIRVGVSSLLLWTMSAMLF